MFCWVMMSVVAMSSESSLFMSSMVWMVCLLMSSVLSCLIWSTVSNVIVSRILDISLDIGVGVWLCVFGS